VSTKKRTPDRGLQREAPPVLLIIGLVVLVLVLGVGAFYAYNGGWKTASQQDESYKHEMLPIMAAKHGDMEPLQAENKLRQQQGQSPLELPKERRQMTADDHQKLLNLQKQLQARQGDHAAP
jgi:uncharacterized protein HemX